MWSSGAAWETDDRHTEAAEAQKNPKNIKTSSGLTETHPWQPLKQQLGEGQGSSSNLRWAVVHHVVVQQGQFHQVLGQRVALYIRLGETPL